MASTPRAAAGVTVKSGWAAAVLIEPAPHGIRVIESRRIDLCDPALPDTRQPYHEGFATMRAPGPARDALLDAVHRAGGRVARGLFGDWGARPHGLMGVAVVTGSLVNPETIANEHIRIHALEGRLFRTVVLDAAREAGCDCAVWRERDLFALAATHLRRSAEAVRKAVAECGRACGGPWRAEQKAAALAAWLLVARPRA